MTKRATQTILKILYILLVVLFIAFIFSNSLESRETSTSKSTGVLKAINEILENINSPITLKEVFIRKCAHFTEFFILGSLLFGLLCMYKCVNKSNLVYAGFFGCLVAMTDETIQYFSNRGSMLLDVWLDFIAASCALLIFGSIYFAYKKRKK